MSAADLRAEADRRTQDALNEAREQRANSWTPAEIAVVLEDAAHIIGDLRDQADAAEELHLELLRHQLWDSACGHQSPMHPNLRCYLHPGHSMEAGHLYTVKITRRAA